MNSGSFFFFGGGDGGCGGVDLRSGVSNCPLLRICSVFEGVIVRTNVILVAVPSAGRGLFGG
jgi:hypothetical protein